MKASFIAGLVAVISWIGASQERSKPICAGYGLQVYTDFSGAGSHSCRIDPSGHLTMLTRPESTPINDSPWVSFRLVSDKDQLLYFTLTYQDGTHRYAPKYSMDGSLWDSISQSGDGFQVAVQKGKAVYIASQPLFSPHTVQAWARTLGEKHSLNLKRIGSTVGGCDILALAPPQVNKPLLLILGRQHPPEVTGFIALKAFVEAALGQADFPYDIVVIPSLNPDGVALGHWRLNKGLKDLNRDWGPFTQPETQSIRDWLKAEGHRPVAVIDFHSTKKSLFYTMLDTELTGNQRRQWGPIWAAHPYVRKPVAYKKNGTAKNYFYRTYGATTMTYEVADDEAVKDIIAQAEKFMTLITKAPKE